MTVRAVDDERSSLHRQACDRGAGWPLRPAVAVFARRSPLAARRAHAPARARAIARVVTARAEFTSVETGDVELLVGFGWIEEASHLALARIDAIASVIAGRGDQAPVVRYESRLRGSLLRRLPRRSVVEGQLAAIEDRNIVEPCPYTVERTHRPRGAVLALFTDGAWRSWFALGTRRPFLAWISTKAMLAARPWLSVASWFALRSRIALTTRGTFLAWVALLSWLTVRAMISRGSWFAFRSRIPLGTRITSRTLVPLRTGITLGAVRTRLAILERRGHLPHGSLQLLNFGFEGRDGRRGLGLKGFVLGDGHTAIGLDLTPMIRQDPPACVRESFNSRHADPPRRG